MRFEPEFISNCCCAIILQADIDGHGKCSECGENCVPQEEELEIISITTVPITAVSDIEQDTPDLSWKLVFAIAAVLLLIRLIQDNLLI